MQFVALLQGEMQFLEDLANAILLALKWSLAIKSPSENYTASSHQKIDNDITDACRLVRLAY